MKRLFTWVILDRSHNYQAFVYMGDIRPISQLSSVYKQNVHKSCITMLVFAAVVAYVTKTTAAAAAVSSQCFH